MEKRGIYYIGRLISAQKGIIFENDHYEKNPQGLFHMDPVKCNEGYEEYSHGLQPDRK